MDSALSPREIQARIRGGATLAEVATEAGVDEARIEGFALPVIAEREHMTASALGCAVRRRGDGGGHRRLRELISSRLQARGLDSDEIVWDSWREPDKRWRLVGELVGHERRAEFLFDPRGRFCVADNADARWMIGEELPGRQDPDNENTVDFDDELALVRATAQQETPPAVPGDDVPVDAFDEGPATSELDDLYDMLSGVSEDSVRIYVGLEDDHEDHDEKESALEETEAIDDRLEVDPVESEPAPEPEIAAPARASLQDSFIAPETEDTAPQPRTRAKRRAAVPSWDEIMFGGPPR